MSNKKAGSCLKHKEDELFFYSRDGEYFLGKNVLNVPFTEKEAKCANLTKDWFTNKEIAKEMNVKPSTTASFLESVRKKMNCHSKIHIIKVLTQETPLPRKKS